MKSISWKALLKEPWIKTLLNLSWNLNTESTTENAMKSWFEKYCWISTTETAMKSQVGKYSWKCKKLESQKPWNLKSEHTADSMKSKVRKYYWKCQAKRTTEIPMKLCQKVLLKVTWNFKAESTSEKGHEIPAAKILLKKPWNLKTESTAIKHKC